MASRDAAPLLRPACAGGDGGQRLDLLQLIALPGLLQDKLLANLEQPHPRLLSPQIFAAGVNQPGPQRHAHFAQVRGNRIGEFKTRHVGEQLLLQYGIDEA